METPNSLSQKRQPAEAAATPDLRNGYHAPTARLAALAMHLGTRGLDIDATPEGGLIARDPGRPDTTHTITCRPRPDDADRLWFYVSADTPIAEADRIFDAAVAICGLLTPGDSGGEHP
jgi:hypothetical protein